MDILTPAIILVSHQNLTPTRPEIPQEVYNFIREGILND
jgi:hypothetical protein